MMAHMNQSNTAQIIASIEALFSSTTINVIRTSPANRSGK